MWIDFRRFVNAWSLEGPRIKSRVLRKARFLSISGFKVSFIFPVDVEHYVALFLSFRKRKFSFRFQHEISTFIFIPHLGKKKRYITLRELYV